MTPPLFYTAQSTAAHLWWWIHQKACTLGGTFARRVPSAPGIQMNVPAIYHNALPPNSTPSSSAGTLSTSTLYDCWRSNVFPFFRPTNGTITCTPPL